MPNDPRSCAPEVRLNTPRLILREHRAEDLQPLHAMLSDPATTWYIPDMYRTDIARTEEYLRSVMADRRQSPRLRLNLIVEERSGGAAVGCVGLHVIEGNAREAHYGLGYFLRSDLWNRGYATEAVGAAVDHIFSVGARRVSAACLAENIGSRRVLEKCGFTWEGLLRSHTLHDGLWKDCAVYGRIKEDDASCFAK